MIKVSVVMPTYNRVALLGRAVESVLNQTYRDFELIVVDDGSIDDTRIFLQKYEADNRFRYAFQENQGQSVARNKAIELANGEYLAFLDSDNYWPLDRLEKSVPYFEQLSAEYGLIYGDGYSVDEENKVIGHSNREGQPDSCLYELLLNNFVGMNAVVARTELVKELDAFDESMRSGEDYDLWLRMAIEHKFKYIPEKLCYYLVEGERISNNFEGVMANNERSIEKVFQYKMSSISERQQRNVWSRFWNRKGRCFAQDRQKGHAFRCYLKALTYSPFSFNVWRSVLALIKN